MNPLPYLCILHADNSDALERTLQNAHDFVEGVQVLALASQPASWPDHLSVQNIETPDSLSELYQQALELCPERPLLLLEAGETLSPAAWQSLSELGPEIQSAILAVRRSEALDYLPRWFNLPPTEPPVFEGRVHPQLPSATWLYQLEIQAQESASPFYQAPSRQAWLKDLASKGYQEADLIYALGLSYFQSQNDSEALKLFQQLSALPDAASQPGQAGANFWRSAAQVMELKTRWELNQREQVIERLESYRNRFPDIEKIPGLWILRGVIAKTLQELDLAMDCFLQARELPKQAHFAHYNLSVSVPEISWKPLLGLAELQLQEGLFSQAYVNFKQVAAQLPGNDYLLTEWLKAAFFIRRYDTIQEILDQGTALRGLYPKTRQMLEAILSIQNGQPLADTETLVQAIEADFDKLQTDPFMVSVMLEFSICLLYQRHFEQARRLIQELTLKLPNQAVLWHNLAYTYFSEQQYAQAEKFYRQALSVDPQFQESRFDLAKVLVMLERRPEALEQFYELQKQAPQDPRYKQAIRQLEPNPPEMFLPALPSEAEPTEAETMPFIFVFPLDASWEHGLDIALKAYYQEFIAEDHVIFAIPAEHESRLVQEARQWAEAHFQGELLPPVALLQDPMPLLAEQSAWVLPWRVRPESALLESIQQSGYPLISTGMSLQQPAGQALPFVYQAEEQQTDCPIWLETDIAALQNQMRLAVMGCLPTVPNPPQTQTHQFLNTETQAQARRLPRESLLKEAADLPGLSVCMIVRDEESMLPRALDSLQGVEEVIVVDTGSQDRTRAIAAAYPNVRLFELEWPDDFAAARNYSIQQASQPWILALDADEYLQEGFVATLKQYLALDQQPDAYAFPILAVDEEEQEIPAKHLLSVPRCFRNDPAYRYRGRIHEMVHHRERSQMRYFQMKQLPIYHRGYQKQVIEERNKLERDNQLMEAMIAEQPDAYETQRMYLILAQSYQAAGQQEEALRLLEQGLERVDDDFVLSMLQLNVVRLLLQLERYQEVLERVKPEDLPVKLQIFKAQALQRLGRLSEALAVVEQALDLTERSALVPDPLEIRLKRDEILHELARLSEQNGKLEQAIYYFKRYLKLAPSKENWQIFEQLQQKNRAMHV